MPIYKITKSSTDAVSQMRQAYYSTLTAPLDGMWEHFSFMADQYLIEDGSQNPCAYCVVNDENKLLQLYAPGVPDAQELFSDIKTKLNLSGAIVATHDAPFLAHCMDYQSAISINALLYQANEIGSAATPAFPPSTDFRLIATSELETAVAFAVAALGAPAEWLTGYYGNLIGRQELFGLWQNGELIAAGERRISDTQKPYADVGMVVAAEYRGKGLATAILQQLVLICRAGNLAPICSTEMDNIAAQKAIRKAGFSSDHRILAVSF